MNPSSVNDAAIKIAARYSILSNPYRILIISLLIERKLARWSDIKQVLEHYSGTLNPNTLNFHLRTLMVAKMIRRRGTNTDVIYTLGDIPDNILATIATEIIQLILPQTE